MNADDDKTAVYYEGTRGNMAEWIMCQAPILRCHGSTPAGGVDKTDA
ncbi:unnamed protein product, partial [Protopolystoma xenopodis]